MMIWNRLKYLWPAWRHRQEREMREELGALIVIAGSKELGNLTLAMEDARATWGWTWLGAAAPMLAADFPGLGVSSPAVYVLVPLALLMVSANASYVPARRAAGLDPVRALRNE